MKCFMNDQDCLYEKHIRLHCAKVDDRSEKPSLYIVSPFGYPYDDVLNAIKIAAGSEDIDVVRGDGAAQLGFIMCQGICKELRKATYVIVDVTEDNANVYYELGLACGFGKKIVLLDGGAAGPRTSGKRAWEGHLRLSGVQVLNYEKLHSLAAGSLLGEVLCNSAYVFDSDQASKDLRKQRSYIEDDDKTVARSGSACRNIFFCVTTPHADKRMLIHGAAETATKRGWRVRLCDIDDRDFSVQNAISTLRNCKVCMIDVTHYRTEINPQTYWILGFSHAIGRDTIPVTNRARGGDFTPFDVRGLYQIYFDTIRNFCLRLDQLLRIVAEKYDEEINEYPHRHLWDRVIHESSRLNVFAFGRGARKDYQRSGFRTIVDTWDYQAVAKLSFFLAQKYRQATVEIEPPEDMRDRKPESVPGWKDYISRRFEHMSGEPLDKCFIVVGSPDVSDYAEFILATGYGIEPCRQTTCGSPMRNQCEGNCKTPCVGRSGYIFYKKNYYPDSPGSLPQLDRDTHPRQNSFCYREATDDSPESVLWYGRRFFCSTGVNYGVVTIFNEKVKLRDDAEGGGGCSAGPVIVLSGFSGIATYGLAVLLTAMPEGKMSTQNVQETAMDLKRRLRKHEDESAVQILVKIDFGSKSDVNDRDDREFHRISVEDVQPLCRVQNEHAA